MTEINGNCNIQTLAFNYTRADNKVIVKFYKTKTENHREEPCKGYGHFDVKISNITELDLSHCDLDALPFCLETLPLKVLNVFDNKLITIPSCIINGLPSIEDLNLAKNCIRNFEKEPACCCKLRKLDLSNNQLTAIPIWIQNVCAINLREFYYSNNITGITRKAQFHKVASYAIKKAVFCSADIRNGNFDFIKSMRTLTHLDLSNIHNRITNSLYPIESFFEKASWCETLQVLVLNNSNISFIPDNIAALVNLRELYLKSNDLLTLPNVIGELKNLQVLDLSQNNLYHLPTSFGQLANLEVLKLHNNILCTPNEIYKLKKLCVLDLYSNELDDFDESFKLQLLDLEQNMFNTSSFFGYEEKKQSYRKQNDLLERLDGPKCEDRSEDNWDRSDESFSEDDKAEPEELNHQGFIEEESWDVVKIKSNPDITSSDDEWDGCFKYPILRNKLAAKPDPVPYQIYQDAD